MRVIWGVRDGCAHDVRRISRGHVLLMRNILLGKNFSKTRWEWLAFFGMGVCTALKYWIMINGVLNHWVFIEFHVFMILLRGRFEVRLHVLLRIYEYTEEYTRNILIICWCLINPRCNYLRCWIKETGIIRIWS